MLRENSPDLAQFGPKARPRDVAVVDVYALSCMPCGYAAQCGPFSRKPRPTSVPLQLVLSNHGGFYLGQRQLDLGDCLAQLGAETQQVFYILVRW